MSDSPLFSPELEGLLREAAADPRSTLLRVPRATSLRGLLERQEPLGERSSELSTLDRHLVAVYRDDLWELLLEACLVQLFSDESVSLNVHRSKSLEEDWEAPPLPEWTAQVEAHLEGSKIQLSSLVGFDLLLEICRGNQPAETSITQLARTALRLRHSSTAEAWIAVDQRLRGQYRSSERIAQTLLAGHLTPSLAASVLETKASCRASIGDFQGAVIDARMAFDEDGSKVSVLVNWMHYAVMSGDQELAREASTLLDSSVTKPTPALVQQIRSFGEFRRAGLMNPDEPMRRVAKALDDEVGPLSKKVLNVYL